MSKSILTADFIITMDAGNRIIEHGAVAIHCRAARNRETAFQTLQ
jgi:hypothetical protein